MLAVSYRTLLQEYPELGMRVELPPRIAHLYGATSVRISESICITIILQHCGRSREMDYVTRLPFISRPFSGARDTRRGFDH